jgi:hypothetical protein
VGAIKRSKFDDQVEKQMEEFFKSAWENRKQISIMSAVIIPSLFVYMWIYQRPLLAKYIPIKQIQNLLNYYIPKVLAAFLLLLILILVRGIFIHLWNKKKYVYTLALPHSKDGVTPQTLGEAIRIIHKSKRSPLSRLIFGKERYSFLIHYGDDESICFYLGAPKDRMGYFKRHWSSLYSRVEYFPPDKLRFPEMWKKKKFKFFPFEIKMRNKKFVGGRLKFIRKKMDKTLSLSRYKVDKIPIILNNMEPNTWLQIAFVPNNGKKLREEIEAAQKETKTSKKTNERSFVDKEELKSWDHRFSGNEVAFDVTISIATEHYPGVHMLKSVGQAIDGLMEDVNGLKYRKMRHSVSHLPSMHRYKMVWVGSELANLVHFPHLTGEGIVARQKDFIPHNSEGRELLPKNVLSNENGVPFGHQYHPFVKDREVRVLPRYIGEHWVLTGENGSGKSTLLNQILKSFNDDFMKKVVSAGYSFIDPARDTALLMLNNLMVREVWENQAAEREGREPKFKINWNKVKWVSWRNTDNPPALNLFYKMEGESEELATDQVFKVIQDYFQPAPQTERLLKMSIRTLMADPGEQHVVLGVRPLLFNEDFRKPIIDRLAKTGKYRDIVEFWRTEAEGMLDASAISLLNRLDIFSSNTFLKRVFGQKNFNFPLRKWMDEGYIILYDFSGMSETEIALVGSYLTYLYYRIADTRDAESTPLLHLFCIDEAHKVPASILPYIVREQRKKGLALGAVTQSIIDLPDELFDALTEVTGNLFVCKQGPKNAKLAASAFTVEDSNGKQKTVYSEAFLRNLPKRTAVVKITDNVDGVEKAYQTVIEVPPLDRYLPNGEIATFGDKKKIAESNRWTLQKAKELQSNDGLHYTEIDKQIDNYLYGEDSEVENVETPKQKVVSMLDILEKKDTGGNDSSHDLNSEEDFPLTVIKKSEDPEPLDYEELQRALDEEQEKTQKMLEEQSGSLLDLL